MPRRERPSDMWRQRQRRGCPYESLWDLFITWYVASRRRPNQIHPHAMIVDVMDAEVKNVIVCALTDAENGADDIGFISDAHLCVWLGARLAQYKNHRANSREWAATIRFRRGRPRVYRLRVSGQT